MKLPNLVASAALARTVTASFSANINYDSPSRRHERLGIDTDLVERRSWKRGNTAYEPSELSFTHGVASGDPWPESVILWTRVAPTEKSSDSLAAVNGTAPLYSHETKEYVEADPNPICVDWKIWEQASNATVKPVSRGRTYTSSDIDYTVKVEADGLKPLTTFNYQFSVCESNVTSSVGRTKTAPRDDDDVSALSFAIFSCASYPVGYFNTYGNAARMDEHDWVIHVGDYFYEYAADEETEIAERASIPKNEIFTLYDYRARHGNYRSDPDLQLLSRDYAWIPTWDDHEVANNVYRDGMQAFNNTEDSFKNIGPEISVDTRKVNAVRAYFEWMPIRQTDLDDGLRVWRSFQMGKLLDLIILDTRLYDRSIAPLGWNDDYLDLIKDDPSRTLMGSRQENWLYNSLSESADRGAKWRLIGNQIIISRIEGIDDGINYLTTDNWSGYVANRNRTLKHLYDNEIGNNIFLAGDSHENWVSDVVWLGETDYDDKTGNGAIGAEFAVTGTSAAGPGVVPGNQGRTIDQSNADSQALVDENSELMWQEGYYRGYYQLSVTPEKVTAKFYGSPTVAERNSWNLPLANFTVVADENHLKRPVGGGQAEAGALKFGGIAHSNLSLNTETGRWEVIEFDKMYIDGQP